MAQTITKMMPINTINPNVLTFIASDNDLTRIKLYQSFCSDLIKDNKEYFDVYHEYNKKPIFIICKLKFNIMKIKDFYIQIYRLMYD